MVPSIDLNLAQQPDDSDAESTGGPEGLEADVTPEQRPAPGPRSTTLASTDDVDGEGIIPFRTSKRLQGRIFSMIQQSLNGGGHDSGFNVSAMTNETNIPSGHIPARKVQRSQKPCSPSPELPVVVCKTEVKIDTAKEVCCDINRAHSVHGRKRNSFTVHFAEPLFAYIEDEKGVVVPNSLRDGYCTDGEALAAQAARKLASIRSSSVSDHGKRHRRSPPISCFDLLCNHVGPKGWRCYRSSEEGKFFCRFHLGRTLDPTEIAQFTVHN